MKIRPAITTISLCLVALLLCSIVVDLSAAEQPALIPQPEKIQTTPGQFLIQPQTKILLFPANDQTRDLADYFVETVSPAMGFVLTVAPFAEETELENCIIFKINPNLNLSDQGYQLNIIPKKITLEATSSTGLFYGVQTLRQLLPASVESDVPVAGEKWSLPCLKITDQPRFTWRGVMLDESRHFFGKRTVKKILERMALHKMNRFHWHLTDEPAWRIEIKQYPLLTEIGSKGSWSNPADPPKFYTQADIKEIVTFAARRHIIVIPEIDMPGHATAANRAYPEHSGGGSEKLPDFTFNPGREQTYQYLENILDETAKLFPGPWIHFGGDEVHFGNEQWKTNPDVIKKLKLEGLATILDMEHYFNRRMAATIQKLGKTTIGWDEITDTGIPPQQAIIMWWRHDKPQQLKKALQNGFQVILCPRIPCYFDFVQHNSHQHGRRWQGKFCPLELTYAYPDPLDKFPPEQRPLIIGIQANVWTERIHNDSRLDFMIYPRLSAIAEACWSKPEQKDFNDFRTRLPKMLNRHRILGDYYFDPFNPEQSPEPAGPQRKN
ncbi:MAG: beta-N-acetylhexosaminidase [Sedimentisphaerales bacterium]|nr:beta-N-acetylhexosaminidase [Sedimentisphaerales bacterium]